MSKILTVPDESERDPNQSRGNHDTLVRVENIGKIFCRNFRKSLAYGVMDGIGDLCPPLKRKSTKDGEPLLRKDEFWANKNISFELRRGDCLGLIGHNGAGKTTLLKMLNGLIKPDQGSIQMKGRVGALIALNAGFNPILSGRENIYITGAVYGMSKKEIDEKFDDIVNFADLWDFIDSPVQNYSSGMQVRLGFSVATAIEPDVLIIDEILAVGDASFHAKCFTRISKLLANAAVIFVSHHMSNVQRLCEKALWLSQGKEVCSGSTSDVLQKYISSLNEEVTSDRQVSSYDNNFKDISCVCDSLITSGDDLKISFSAVVETDFKVGTCMLGIKDSRSNLVAQSSHKFEGSYRPNEEITFVLTLKNLSLNADKYSLNLNLASESAKIILLRVENACSFQVRSTFHSYSAYQPISQISIQRP